MTVIIILGVLMLVISVGTDVSKKVADQYGKVKDSEISIEKTEYGFKLTKLNDGAFRILQLTDVHIGGGFLCIRNDRLALTAVATVVNYTKPDFIVVTGDVTYPVPFQSGSINNRKAADIFVHLMDNLGVPWTVTFGNHDTESYSLYTRSDITDYYIEVENCLMSPKIPDVYGYGNQFITLHNKDGELNTALVMVDSNQYLPNQGLKINQYDYIRDDQVEWYANGIRKLSEGRATVVPSMMFFHIPLEEYDDAYESYLRGESKLLMGDKREKVAKSTVESNMFEKILELNSTKAVFCGHDHVNDFSVDYKGVILTYGKSIDYLAYAWSGIIKKTEQRGGTIIDINPDSSFKISAVKYSDII